MLPIVLTATGLGFDSHALIMPLAAASIAFLIHFQALLTAKTYDHP